MAMTVTAEYFGAAETQGKSLVKRVYERLVHAREVQARHAIMRELCRYDDRTLADLGLTRDELATRF